LKDVSISCDDLTVLVGGNGTGKSCLLKALELFYKTKIEIEKQDYYNGNTDDPISIIVSYSDLTQHEKKQFKSYWNGNTLSIEKRITFAPKRIIQGYYGEKFKNPEFDAFRKAKGTDLKKEYNKLITKTDYKTFPAYQNKTLAEEVLETWETSNTKKCKPFLDDGTYFGFDNFGTIDLKNYTKFILIPAVQEAGEEGVEENDSVFEKIMEIVVKTTLKQNEKLTKLADSTKKRYDRIIDSSKNKELKTLATELTSKLSFFVPDSEVKIQWLEGREFTLPMPKAYVTLKEGNYHNTVDRCGHGLQRAYILSLFQHLAHIQSSESLQKETAEEKTDINLPSMIIGIEEPELYQHPDRIRYFANTLLQLSKKGLEGTFENIQIVHSTHSPLLVDFKRVDQIRIFRKISDKPTEPKVTTVTYTTLSKIARTIEKIKGDRKNSISPESVRQRLIQVMNPWVNEGFFARLVVLVEGIKDRALILGEAIFRKEDLESKGVTVIPCAGKHNLPKILPIFHCLKIPTYTVWDSDNDKKKREDINSAKNVNKEILCCLNCTPEDYPVRTTDSYCCVDANFEKAFRKEIGKIVFEREASKYCEDNNLGGHSYAMENPFFVAKMIKLFNTKKRNSKTVEGVVDKIVERIQHI
jgi:putative ATP-dependent endonuclease of OLD family